ncbi:MAG: hypothetical protein LBK01_02910 [Burkholderiaceae bacterium]|jgi:hypothetical protein|nr:hypothetical protein [Burkholderiaceae bacterium]
MYPPVFFPVGRLVICLFCLFPFLNPSFAVEGPGAQKRYTKKARAGTNTRKKKRVPRKQAAKVAPRPLTRYEVASFGGIGFTERARANRHYTRLFVENRCYQDVMLVAEEKEKAYILSTVRSRERALTLFTWTDHVFPEDAIRFRREAVADYRLTFPSLFSGSGKYEHWEVGDRTVLSWHYVVCKKEPALDDPVGETWRVARQGEMVDEYEVMLARSDSPGFSPFAYDEVPVSVTLNGFVLHPAATDGNGVVHILFPSATAGTIQMGWGRGSIYTARLKEDLKPVRTRPAQDGERVWVAPHPRAPGEW